MHLPSFHTLGICSQLYVPLASVTSVSVYPPTSFTKHTEAPVMPTSDNMVEHSKNTRANVVLVIPAFLETWSSQPEKVEWLKTLECVVSSCCVMPILPPTNALPQGFSGGPLSVKVGDALVHAGVNIRPVYGGTEFGPTTPLIGQKEGNVEDWSWMQFSDRVKVRWVPQGGGHFECQYLVGISITCCM
jgi:hypothetical protein